QGRSFRLREQGLRRGAWHLALEPDVGIAAFLAIPSGKERGERQLRIDDEVAAFGLPHQCKHPGNHGLTRVGLLDRAELGGGDFDVTRHAKSTPSRSRLHFTLAKTPTSLRCER